MIYEKDLAILHDDNSSFTELSKELNDYERDSANITLEASTGFIYIGLYKPFNTLYTELISSNNESTGTTTISYYNGTGFTSSPPYIVDETNSFRRSGFIEFTKPDDWSKTTINGDELFWLQIKTDVTTSSINFRAINILFCNDNELRKELSTVDKYLDPNGANNSFASTHSIVRDNIVQSLRLKGKAKMSGSLENITKWDLLDIDEVSVAAKYFALEKIYFQASDGIDDKWEQRQRQASQEGNKAFDLIYLSLDENDDGIKDEGESMRIQTINVQRI